MSKVLAGFLVLLGMAFFFSSRDSARFQGLSPAKQYEERCRYGAMASTMAAEFIRLRLSIVESPKFETFNVQKFVRKERNAANDCVSQSGIISLTQQKRPPRYSRRFTSDNVRF